MSELLYQANFVVQLLELLLELGTAIAGLAVIFSYTQTFGGWTPDEVLTLVKPEDAQILASVQSVDIWKLTDVALGIGVLALALVRMGVRVDAAEALAFAAALLAGGVTVYSFWVIVAATAFWCVRVENILVVFQSMYEAGCWPVSIYPGWLRFGLTFIVPIAFAVTVPAQALTGRLSGWNLGLAWAVAAFLFAGARMLWKVGLRRYDGASS
jgi:ABC-2 type transport system permease protein